MGNNKSQEHPQPVAYQFNQNFPVAHFDRIHHQQEVLKKDEKAELTKQTGLKYDDDENLIFPKQLMKEQAKEGTSSDLKDLVSLSLKLKNPVVKASSFVNQVIPMLLSLKAKQINGQRNAPIDLICVLDSSDSMYGEKLDLLKNTFKYLLEYLFESDRLSIVEFNSWGRRITPLTCMNEYGKTKTLDSLQQIRARGCTDICDGMRHAFEIIKQRKQANQMTGIFLLSDGLDFGADKDIRSTMQEMELMDNFSIHSFGYGNDHDPKLMANIADIADGNFYFVEKLDTIDECFVDCLGGLLSSIAKDITISITPNDKSFLKGLEISKAYGDASMWTKNGQTYTTKLSQLISGRTKDFILKVKLPKYSKDITDDQKNITLINAVASMTSLNQEKVELTDSLQVTILNEIEEIHEQPNDSDVLKNFYRVKMAEILEQAKDLLDKKDYVGAQKILKDFKEELENCELNKDQFVLNLIRDIDSANLNAQPKIYEQEGKIKMIENARAQYQQKTNLKSANIYQNEIQCSMVSSIQSRKQ